MSVDMDVVDGRIRAIAGEIVTTAEGATAAQKCVLLLADRAMDLRQASLEVAVRSPAASAVILRALVDLAILIRWIELRPRLHALLWAAEGTRLDMHHREALGRAAVRRNLPKPAPQADRADAKRIVRRARCLALGRGVIDENNDGLLPSIWARVKAIDEVVSTEEHPKPFADLYDQGVSFYSAWTHSGSNSLLPPPDAETARILSASVVAGALASTSRQRGLPYGPELDFIRHSVVAGQWVSG